MPEVSIDINANDEATPILDRVTNAFNMTSVASAALGFSVANMAQDAAAGLRNFVESTVEAGAQVQFLTGRAEVLFGQNFPQAMAQIDALSASMRRSTGEMLGFAVQADAFTQSMGMSGEQAQSLSIGMSGLAEEISKATGKSSEEAFSGLERGLRGMGRALTDVGIALDQHTLQTYMNAQGLHEQFTKLDDASKAIVSYNFVLSQKGLLDAEAAKNQDSFTEKTKQLGAAWQTFEETLGKLTVGPATAVVGELTKDVEGFTKAVDLARMAWNGMLVETADGGFAVKKSPVQDGPSSDQDKLLEDIGLSADQITQIKAKKMMGSLKEMPESTDKAAKAFEALQTRMESLGTTYDTVSSSMDDKLRLLDTKHGETMSSIMDSVQNVIDKVKDLDTAYSKAMDDINGKKVDNVVAEFQKIQDMAIKVEEGFKGKGALSADQVANVIGNLSPEAKAANKVTQTEVSGFNLDSAGEKQVNDVLALNKEEEALNGWLTKNNQLTDDQKSKLTVGSTDYVKNLSDVLGQNVDVKGKIANGGQTQFEKSMQAEDKKADDLTGKHSQAVADQDAEIVKLKQKAEAAQSSYGIERSQIVQTQSQLLGFHDVYIQSFDHMASVTKTTVDQLEAQLKRLSKIMTDAQAQIIGKAGAAYSTRQIQLTGLGAN